MKYYIFIIFLFLIGCNKNKDIEDVVVNINPPKPIIKRFGEFEVTDIKPKIKSFTTTINLNAENQNTENKIQDSTQEDSKKQEEIKIDPIEKNLEINEELNFEELQKNNN